MRRVVLPNSLSVSPNMTPMIDVIFNLIIFFLCVSQFQKAESDASIDLPRATSKDAVVPAREETPPLVLNLLADERVLVAGRPVAVAELWELLRRRQRLVAPAALEVWIRADRHVAYQAVEPVLLQCAKAGIWKVAFKVLNPRGGGVGAEP